MKKIYLLFCFFIVAENFLYCQSDSISHKPDSVHIVKYRGIEFGCNIVPFVSRIITPSTNGMEFAFNVNPLKNFILSFQGGFNSVKDNQPLYNYKSNGNFMTIGVDYNFYRKNNPGEHNMFLIGVHYGFAQDTYSAENITIADNYWGDRAIPSIAESKAKASWFEIAAGIKVEVVKNFSMGWSVSGLFMTKTSGMSNVKPYAVPGYGNAALNSNIRFTYTLYYKIPIF